MRKLTTEQFIKRAQNIHNDKYDYSKTEYINSSTKICIICPEHGDFWQNSGSHLHGGSGCPTCANISNGLHLKYSWNNVKQSFIDLHGSKYDYSKFEYINTHTKGLITCNECGNIFSQSPHSHKMGMGCKPCSVIIGSNKHKLTTNEFIDRSVSIHGDIYNYSSVVYNTMRTKVCIICPKHGEFWMTPSTHIFKERGCRNCKIDRNDSKYTHYIYEVRNVLTNMIYIGRHSTKNIDDNYMGSGVELNKDQHKYGINNFERTILEYHKTWESVVSREHELVNIEFINRCDTYNVRLGG